MIRNRYNYLTPSVQDTKGKEGRTESNNTTIKTLQRESQKARFFPKIGQTAIQYKNFTRTYAKTYNDRNNKPQQKHLERSVKILLGEWGRVGGGWFIDFT